MAWSGFDSKVEKIRFADLNLEEILAPELLEYSERPLEDVTFALILVEIGPELVENRPLLLFRSSTFELPERLHEVSPKLELIIIKLLFLGPITRLEAIT